jgi:hypothetical protein
MDIAVQQQRRQADHQREHAGADEVGKKESVFVVHVVQRRQGRVQ